VKEGVSALVA